MDTDHTDRDRSLLATGRFFAQRPEMFVWCGESPERQFTVYLIVQVRCAWRLVRQYERSVFIGVIGVEVRGI